MNEHYADLIYRAAANHSLPTTQGTSHASILWLNGNKG